MVDNLVLESLLPESLIRQERIGVDRAARFDVCANLRLERVFFTIAHDSGANLTTAFENAHDSNLVFGASLGDSALAFVGVHEAGRATDEGFVGFYVLPFAAYFVDVPTLESQAETVQHKPCGLLSDSQVAANLIGANAVFAVHEHPQSHEPFVERHGAILENRAYFDGELFPAILALPPLLSRKVVVLCILAMGTYRAVGPADRGDGINADLLIAEVLDSLLESFGLHGDFRIA